ncbi:MULTISPECIES: DedA family protein [unclassified Streptomyces]|uniref:DedA family protein n=1 Tax=unclassified Streptomyces TaxID=2593676 RepID=UPI00278BD423|nr:MULTISPECIES: VTT domain-containing protein [unclassified Streptomyces]
MPDVLLYGLLVLCVMPPLVPNSWLLITAGAMVADGRLSPALVLLVVAGAACAGDLMVYRCTRRFGGPVLRWLRRSRRRAALLDWAALRVRRHGIPFVIGIRFLPTGRFVGAVAAGLVEFRLSRFLCASGIAETVWASYSLAVGVLGGIAAGGPFFGALAGVALSCAVATLAGGVQWFARWPEGVTSRAGTS